MKSRILLIAVVAVGVVAGGVFATPTADNSRQQKKNGGKRKGDEQARLQSQAKITMEQAKEIALSRAAGNVESSELEREHGKLVYSFDIRNAKGTITEVQVDAITESSRELNMKMRNRKPLKNAAKSKSRGRAPHKSPDFGVN